MLGLFYEIFYQFFFFASKLILIYVEITALSLSYHLYNGARLRAFGLFRFVLSWLGGRRGILFRFISKALFYLEFGNRALPSLYKKEKYFFVFLSAFYGLCYSF